MKNRVIKNLAAASAAQVITIVIQLSLIPLYLKFWGKESLGQWFILQSFCNWLFLSDFGLIAANSTEMTLLASQNKDQQSANLFKSVSLLSSLSFIFFSSVFIFLSSSPAFWNLLGVTNLSENPVWITLFLSLHAFIMQRTGILHDVLRAHGNLSRATNWNNLLRLAEFCMSGTVVVLGGGMTLVALALVLVRALGLYFFDSAVKKRHTWVLLPANVHLSNLKTLTKPAFAFMLTPLSDRIKFDGTNLLLGALFGPAIVSTFISVRTLANSVYQLGALFRLSVLPEFSILMAGRELEKATSAYFKCLIVSLSLTLITSIILLKFGAPLYELWTHQQLTFDPLLLQLFLLGIICHTLSGNAALAAIAVNEQLPIQIRQTLACIASIAICFCLTPFFSYYSFALVTVLTEAFVTPFAFKKSMEALGLDFEGYSSIRKHFRA